MLALPALAADAHLELLVRVMPDTTIEPSCLVELEGIVPDGVSVATLADRLGQAGLRVTLVQAEDRWLMTAGALSPETALPELLNDGAIVRVDARRWGPATVYRTYLTIGGPGGFLSRLRGELAAALPEVGAMTAGTPAPVGGGLSLPSAIRVEVPGRITGTSAPAKAGDALHWDVRLDSDQVVLAEVASIVIDPLRLVLWLMGLLIVAALAWAAGDIAIRAARARHSARDGHA